MDFKFEEELLVTLKDAWNFKILTVDQNVISFGSIIVGVTFFTLGIFVSRFLSKRLIQGLSRRLEIHRSNRHAFESVVFYFFTVFATLFALKLANIPLTVFTVIGGAIAIGVGLGSQNLVNNFISGTILMFERPIKVGDFIEVDGVFGEVETIGMRCTKVHTYGNKHIIVPNSSFLEKNVLNWTHLNEKVRTNISIGIAYGSDTELAKKVLVQAVQSEHRVLTDEPIDVFFSEFGDNSLNFRVDFWIDLINLDQKRSVESNIRFEIDKRFRENGIVIAFPQRDLHLHSVHPLAVELVSKSRDVQILGSDGSTRS